MIVSMAIFGTIGVFRIHIPLPSGFTASVRGLIGGLFLLFVCLIKGQKIDFKKAGKKLPVIILSGVLIGTNWILLFEAYNHTSIATATLCYYMAPVFVTVASSFLFGEKLGTKKVLCLLCAIIGMSFVSGVFNSGSLEISGMGIALALSAAVLYASVVLLNKKLSDIDSTDRTILQLLSAGIVLLPYSLCCENLSFANMDFLSVALLILLGLLHTGVAYLLYFSSMSELPLSYTALLGYIDPLVALVLSVIIGQSVGVFEIVGGILILGSSCIGIIVKDKIND